MAESETYRVVLFSRPDDPAELRELLAEQLGLNRVDAGIAAHHAPGVLPQKLNEGTAEKAATAISTLGVRSITVEQSQLIDPSSAESVHHVACSDDGFALFDLSGNQREAVPWSDVCLVCSGRVPLDQTHHFQMGNRLHASPLPPDGTVDGTMRGCEAWLILDNPRRVIHIDSNHMNYEYLGERKSTSGTSNFELLLNDIVAHATQAYITPTTRACIGHAGVASYDFDSSKELQQVVVVQDLLARELTGRHGSEEADEE